MGFLLDRFLCKINIYWYKCFTNSGNSEHFTLVNNTQYTVCMLLGFLNPYGFVDLSFSLMLLSVCNLCHFPDYDVVLSLAIITLQWELWRTDKANERFDYGWCWNDGLIWCIVTFYQHTNQRLMCCYTQDTVDKIWEKNEPNFLLVISWRY